MNDFIRKFFANYIVQILVFSSLGAVFTAALVTHSNSDPSFNLISHKYPDNALSFFGAHLSDILYQLFGLGAFIFPLYFLLHDFISNLNLFNISLISGSNNALISFFENPK